MDETKHYSLSDEGVAIIKAFQNACIRCDQDATLTSSKEKLLYELERFKMWANSLGLSYHGRSSLDYRLRDSGTLLDHVISLLRDLQQILKLGMFLELLQLLR